MYYDRLIVCSFCGEKFRPHRGQRIFGKVVSTCGNPVCQRKRKTELQRQRRTGQATLQL